MKDKFKILLFINIIIGFFLIFVLTDHPLLIHIGITIILIELPICFAIFASDQNDKK